MIKKCVRAYQALTGFAWRRDLVAWGVGIALFGFIVGAVVDDYIAKSPIVVTASEAVHSLYRNVIEPRISDPVDNGFYYYRSRFGSAGVLKNDVSRTHPGATLYSGAYPAAAHLISADGELLHSWTVRFSAIWKNPSHIEIPVPDEYVVIRKAQLLPDGELLAIFEAPGHWPYAYGLAKLDRQSKPIWVFSDLVNHDLDVAPDGSIYTLVHKVRRAPRRMSTRSGGRRIIDDELLVLSPHGDELLRISLVDALLDSKFAGLISARTRKNMFHPNSPPMTEDVLHTNSVHYVTSDIASRFPIATEGQVLLSFLKLSALAILDVDSKIVSWVMRGSWRAQHSARFLNNGTIGVFDNTGKYERGGRSRVIEVDPRTGGVEWAFAGDGRQIRLFHTTSRGSFQRLPNGNTLITESNAGRLLEVSPDKTVVWEYVVTDSIGEKMPALFWASRHSDEALSFLSSNRSTISGHDAPDRASNP